MKLIPPETIVDSALTFLQKKSFAISWIKQNTAKALPFQQALLDLYGEFGDSILMPVTAKKNIIIDLIEHTYELQNPKGLFQTLSAPGGPQIFKLFQRVDRDKALVDSAPELAESFQELEDSGRPMSKYWIKEVLEVSPGIHKQKMYRDLLLN